GPGMSLRRKAPKPPTEHDVWSYCEPATAILNTWHIRRLTDTGRHLSGGVDTPSLCGRVDPAKFGGWDLGAPFSWEEARRLCTQPFHGGGWMVCPGCVTAAEEATDA